MLTEPGSSRTLGEPDGEMLDTLPWLQVTPVESAMLPVTPMEPLDFEIKQNKISLTPFLHNWIYFFPIPENLMSCYIFIISICISNKY